MPTSKRPAFYKGINAWREWNIYRLAALPCTGNSAGITEMFMASSYTYPPFRNIFIIVAAPLIVLDLLPFPFIFLHVISLSFL